MNDEHEIAMEIEAENERLEMERIKPLPINKKPVNEAKIAWMVGTVALDFATAYYIWQTTIFFYGLLWIAIGAGGLIWSERQRERIGNNDEQKRIGSTGVIVSALAVFLMGLAMGAVYLIGMTEVRWVMVAVEAFTVILFGYHLVQAYRYHDVDDEYQEQNADSIAEASNVSEMRQIHRAAARVAAKKRKNLIRDSYRNKHGEAFDAALKSINPNKQNQKPQNNQQNAPRNVPVNALAAETDMAELKENKNPQNPPREK